MHYCFAEGTYAVYNVCKRCMYSRLCVIVQCCYCTLSLHDYTQVHATVHVITCCAGWWRGSCSCSVWQ